MQLNTIESDAQQIKCFLAALAIDQASLVQLPELARLDTYRKELAQSSPGTAHSIPQPCFRVDAAEQQPAPIAHARKEQPSQSRSGLTLASCASACSSPMHVSGLALAAEP